MSDQVTVTIDGISVLVPKGERIIESARRVGVDIPFFCYHPRLSMEAGANCRMCLVEVSAPRPNPDGTVALAKMPKPQTACSLPASDGMVIDTQSDVVTKARRAVLEFLLINHPLDCPICDRGGECPLQNNTIHYGPSVSRFSEEKRHKPKAVRLSDYVVLDRERCIQCARCTRFTEDISGDAQLGFLKRGADIEVSTFMGDTFSSLFSGNTIEICPVGALTSRTYRFGARPWDLTTTKSICTECSNGCNVKLDCRIGSLLRVNARVNEAVNEEWTCDRGKFGTAYVSSGDRLRHPLIRKDGRFVASGWDEALSLVSARLREAGSKAAAIGGSASSNESVYALQRLMRDVVGTAHLDHRMSLDPGPTRSVLLDRTGHHTTGLRIADVGRRGAVLTFGCDLPSEQPMVYLRARKAWRQGTAAIVDVRSADVSTTEHMLDVALQTVLHPLGAELAAAEALASAAVLLGEPGKLPAELCARYQRSLAEVAEQAGISTDDALAAVRPLMSGVTILAGSPVQDSPDRDAIVSRLADLAVACGSPGCVEMPVRGANEQGAMDLGMLPDSGPGYVEPTRIGRTTKHILEGVVACELTALWIARTDLVGEFADRDLAVRALECCPFVVCTSLELGETSRMADVVLPVQIVPEGDGTITNVERRVQRFWRAMDLGADVRAEWLVASQVAGMMGSPMAFGTASDVMQEIVASVPIYAACSYDHLGDGGVRWLYPSESGDQEER